MNKFDLMNVDSLMANLVKAVMREAVDVMWNKSEEELIEDFKLALITPNDEDCPTLFTMMYMVGLIGTVLVSKYGKDENELMKVLKDSNSLFVKEIKNEQSR